MVSGNTSARSTLPSGTLVHLPQPTPAPLAMLTAAVEVAKLGLGSLRGNEWAQWQNKVQATGLVATAIRIVVLCAEVPVVILCGAAGTAAPSPALENAIYRGAGSQPFLQPT